MFLPVFVYSISAQSNFAVGAVVNASFGSITELTFYITALLRGHHQSNMCLQEIVKAALTGTLLGCILFIPVSDWVQTHLRMNCTFLNVPSIHSVSLSLSFSFSQFIIMLRGSVWSSEGSNTGNRGLIAVQPESVRLYFSYLSEVSSLSVSLSHTLLRLPPPPPPPQICISH